MILAVASVGWGLFAVGALSHITHFERFVALLSVHLRPARPVAGAVVAGEALIAVAVPVALLVGLDGALSVAAVVGAIIGAGFAVWIARLLLTGSQLPCACSFSEAPTSMWSLGRAVAAIVVGAFAFGASSSIDAGSWTIIAALVVGLAAGAVLFILPDAVAWPEPSLRLRATLAAIPADRPASGPTSMPVSMSDGPSQSQAAH